MNSEASYSATTHRLAAMLVNRALVSVRPTVLLEGPSGAGKSTLADAIVAEWPEESRPELIRMDDLCPGWYGLAHAERALITDVLEPRAAGLPASWRRYDWDLSRWAETVPVDPARPLLVEGCGALSRESAAFATLRIWLGADDTLRRERAIARDGSDYARLWGVWQRQYDEFTVRQDPRSRADIWLEARAQGPRVERVAPRPVD